MWVRATLVWLTAIRLRFVAGNATTAPGRVRGYRSTARHDRFAGGRLSRNDYRANSWWQGPGTGPADETRIGPGEIGRTAEVQSAVLSRSIGYLAVLGDLALVRGTFRAWVCETLLSGRRVAIVDLLCASPVRAVQVTELLRASGLTTSRGGTLVVVSDRERLRESFALNASSRPVEVYETFAAARAAFGLGSERVRDDVAAGQP